MGAQPLAGGTREKTGHRGSPRSSCCFIISNIGELAPILLVPKLHCFSKHRHKTQNVGISMERVRIHAGGKRTCFREPQIHVTLMAAPPGQELRQCLSPAPGQQSLHLHEYAAC